MTRQGWTQLRLALILPGLLLSCGGARAANTATFVAIDSATQGSWHGVYGADGHSIANDSQTLPSYTSFAVQNGYAYTWASSTTDVRALQNGTNTDRLASAWYNGSSFSYTATITDGNVHQIALYALDWDRSGRTETIQILDGTTGTVLDTRSASSIGNGEYFIWDISGNIKINVTLTGSANAVVSGVFWDPNGTYQPPTPGTASFIGIDPITKGNWHGVYGGDGYSVANDSQSLPAYTSFSVTNGTPYTWTSTTDPRALQNGANNGRLASAWYSSSSFSFDVKITDGNLHQLALYVLDWGSQGRAETIQLQDGNSGDVLDTRSIPVFTNGEYVAWNVSGHVKVLVTLTGSTNAVVSGIFWDVDATTKPTITSMSPNAGIAGTQVTINGTNFGSTPGSVTFNGTSATTSGWTSTQFVATVPGGATSGPLVITVGGLKNFPTYFSILPSGWLDQDVGTVGSSGAASYVNGSFQLTGAGNYIDGTADAMHFAYQSLSGNGTLIARVMSLAGGSSPQAAAIIRETLDAGATAAFVYYSPSQAFLNYRPSTGASTASQNISFSPTTPYWIELSRSGNIFTAYVSGDGFYWEQVGSSQTITMAQNVYIGLGVSSNQDPNLATASFDNVSVASASSPASAVTSVSATTGSIGEQIVISGTGFGASQGSSLVYLNDVPVTVNSWGATSITITIPSGATSGLLGVAVAPSMDASSPVDFEVTAQPLPTPWLDRDIAQPGTLGLAGSATYSSSVFAVTGAGTGLGGTADGMHFVYQSLSGDGTILARVTSIAGSGTPEASALIRETLDPGATEAFVYYTPNQAFLNYRPSVGASTTSQNISFSPTPPYWIELTRSGSTFTGYVSLDGVYWAQVGASQTITMAENVYVGLAVSSDYNTTLATITFDNVQLIAGTPYPTPVVTGATPNPVGPGYSVTIAGSNFGSPQGTNAVYFNGVQATTIASWAAGQIVATVPNTATSGPVTVVVNGIGSNQTVSLTIYKPVITSLVPPFGSPGGIIDINGSGFTAAGPGELVYFNGVAATVSTWADTMVQAIVPADVSNGPVTVSLNGIVSAGSTFAAIEPLSVTSISPTFGAAGSTVTITGAGFGPNPSDSIVTFYGGAASIVSWSDTQIQAVVPSTASTGPVTVQVADVIVTGLLFTLTTTYHLTDSKNNITAYTSVVLGGQWRPLQIQGSGCSGCTGRGNISFTYDAQGNVLSRTNELGYTSSYTYDSNNNVLTIAAPPSGGASATTTYTYNLIGEPLTVTDPLGYVTTNTYNSKGNLLAVTTPAPGGSTAASQTQFAYNAQGELTTITDPLNHVTTITYTPVGLISTITDVQNNVTTYQYDNFGNRTSVKDALSNVTTFAYDAMNRLTTINYPTGGGTSTFTYDIRGRRTSVTDQNSKKTTYAYDDADRLTSVTDAANNVTTYAYDTENNLTSIQDASNHTTSFVYDAFGRVTQTDFPSTQVETYGYDAAGNLTSKTDRKNQAITYAYDQLNRLTEKLYPDSTAVNYTYDNDSRLTQVIDPTGTYAFTFDNMGRLTNTTTNYAFLTGRTLNTTYSYDAASNRTGFTDPESGATAYVYDTLNRLQTLTPPSAYGTGNFGFTYDALSRRTGLTRPNAVSTTYAYDNLSRLLSVTHANSGTTLDGASYAVDAAGNRTSRTALPGTTATNFAYDNIYELLSATQGSTTNESYTYDPVGNRLSALGSSSWTPNSSNELTGRPGVTYTYDNNGDTLTEVTSSGTTTFNWDYENRLTNVALPGSGGTVSFKYDPFGRRIDKSSSAGTSVYAYDGQHLIEETNSSGTAVARYSQGLDIDEPLAMLRSATTSYYEADGLGSVTSLSNSAGTLAQTYTFDSFGKQTATSGSLTNPFQYTGREFDSETGIYYYRARYFDPSAGRFLSEDRLGFQGGANFYRYAQNNPLVWIDPSGDNLCYSVTPNGMMEEPCADPGQGMNCIYVPGGMSCDVPIPSGPPPAPNPGLANPFSCACDPLSLTIEAQKILNEQQDANLHTLVEAGLNSAFFQAAERIIEHVGPKALGPLFPVLDLISLGRDGREIMKHGAEAGKKLDKLFGPCLH
jgi:RHS repeat-associated protein